jgi:acyl-CoA synthetase (AMP-forming)/AMP-acid ligase II
MTTRPLDYPPTVANLLRHAAAHFPARDYLVTPDRRLGFGDAEAQSRRLATRLLRGGVGKGTRVAIMFPQGPEFIVALLAVTRIGALAVPLSTFLRGPELRRAIRHADVHLVVAPRMLLGQDTQELFEATWPELVTTPAPELFLREAPYLRRVWLCGDVDRPWATRTPVFADLDVADLDVTDLDDLAGPGDDLLREVEGEVRPSDPMVMIHTSGATAEPKAVVHTHGAQVRHSWTLAQLYRLTEETRTFTTMPFFWVGGLTVSLLSHLHVGGAVLTVERMEPRTMLDLIEGEGATRVIGWTLVERIMAEPSLAGRDLAWLVDLQAAGVRKPGLRHNSLGMSETSGPHTAAADEDNTDDLPEALRGSFGPPVPGVRHKIVDPETGKPPPDGVEGEICVRGYSLMDGLYKKERDETFDEDGWYRTGDRGFFRDGYLLFTGRLTEMIKTGGANVAPREVELAVESLPGVKAAFVVGLPDAERGQIVGCLVCPEPGCELSGEAMTAQLRDQLSSFKIPRQIVVTDYDDAPWLASGKISKPRVIEMLLSETRPSRH